ncbi:MAG TPA: hypothetical protein VLT61_13930 [Anaeromyxobacteraceae bacterium]|nr:hypothetical protein [Anaeromyxobacteraceae bacterium]
MNDRVPIALARKTSGRPYAPLLECAMVSCSWRLLWAAVCLAAAPAAPRAGEPSTPMRLALVLLEKGTPDRALIDGFLAELGEVDGRAGSFSIIGQGPGARVGGAQPEAAVACGADLQCIAAIGEKVGATHVLIGRAMPQQGGVTVQWLLVGVGTPSIVGKHEADLHDASGARAAADRFARQLLGVGPAELDGPVAVGASGGASSGAGAVERGGATARPGDDRRSSWRPRGPIAVAAIAGGALSIGAGVYLVQRAQLGGTGLVHDAAGGARLASPRLADGGRIAARAGVLFAAGGALAAGGAALWRSDSLTVTPVIGVAGDAGIAGVSGTW